jgi:hypothetical protein
VYPKPNQVEFPLTEPRNVAVDSQGRIYVTLVWFGRIQRYSPDGKFERGWDVPVMGFFTIRTTPEDHVLVASGRKNTLLTFSADGELLKREENLPEDLTNAFRKETETTGPYAVDNRRWNPRIVDTRTGQTAVETPWPLRPFVLPYPAFAYAWIGFVLLQIANFIRWCAARRASKQEALAPSS